MQKLLLSEYLVLLATFVAIQVVGIDGGIIFGLIVAIIEHVVTSSQLPSLRRVLKQSTAIWGQNHRQFIQDVVYSRRNPQIMTLEITETVFFGSSLLVFSQICSEIGLNATSDEMYNFAMNSPRMHSYTRSPRLTPPLHVPERRKGLHRKLSKTYLLKHRPKFVVLEMTQVSNVDASAARSCFLQLAKMCSKYGITLCAAGANSRVQRVFRSHDISYTSDEEEIVKGMMLNPFEHISSSTRKKIPSCKLVLFTTVNECLELCENQLIYEHQQNNLLEPPKLGSASHTIRSSSQDLICHDECPTKIPLSKIFERILGMEDGSSEAKEILKPFDEEESDIVEELALGQNEKIFSVGDDADCFYIVLCGRVRICRKLPSNEARDDQVLSMLRSSVDREVSYINIGQVFGYVDYALKRRRSFNAGE